MRHITHDGIGANIDELAIERTFRHLDKRHMPRPQDLSATSDWPRIDLSYHALVECDDGWAVGLSVIPEGRDLNRARIDLFDEPYDANGRYPWPVRERTEVIVCDPVRLGTKDAAQRALDILATFARES